MIGKLLTFKGVKMMCVPVLMVGTGVVTQTNHKRISHAVKNVKHSVNRVTHKKVFKEPEVEAVAVATATASAAAYCPPAYDGNSGGYSGGGFGSSGSGVGGAYGFSNPPVISPVKPIGPISSVPEPGTWFMMIGGFFGVGSAIRRKSHARLRGAEHKKDHILS